MSDQQPLSRAQSAYPYSRPLPQHNPYGPGNGQPPPPLPPHGRIHHHAYTDSALIAGAPGPLSAAGYPVSANPAYQPLSYNQAPYSNGVSANPPPQQYGGPPLQPPPGPVHSRSDPAVPTMSGAPPPPSPYWAGPAQPVGPGGPSPYSPPPGAQPPHINPSSPTGSSPRQSFGSYQEHAPRHPGLPPLPQKEYTAPVGPHSAAPPYGFHVPPALPPLPPKIMLPTPPAVPQPDPMMYNGDQQQQFQQPMQSSPTSMPQELAPNGNLQPADDEFERALRLSMESFAAENQRHDPAAEDEEARILRESREEYERQQERSRMLMSANDESEEEMMARVMAMSLAEEVNKQKQIERQIQRSSRDNMPGPSGSSSRPSFDDESELPYRTSGLTHSASTSSRSSVGRTHTPRPHIVTSISDPLGSRSPTPNPSQTQQSSFQSPTHTQPPNPRSPTSPNSPNSMDMLPQYEEVASSPQRRVGQPHLSPIPTTPGLTASPSSVPQSGILESPGLQLPHSMSEPTMSPVGLSPGAQVSPSLSPHQMAQGLQGSPPQRHRPHSSTLPSTPNGGGSGGLHRGSSSPSTGAILNQQAQHQLPQGAPGLRTSRSSTQLALNRPHTMQGDGQNVPPVPQMPTMPMPVPTLPNGLAAPRPATANADLRGRLSPQPPATGPPQANMNGAGPSTSPGAKRIQMEAEYSNKVSFGYMPPPLDQPVIPPCPAFPETVVIQADAAFHISAPTWHHLMKLLARLGEAKVVPSPAAFSSMPLTSTAADLRLILHFHKNKMGGEWRVVLWMDYDRALPKSMTPNERGRWTNGDTTLLPWGSRVPEESISGPLRGPGPMEVSTSTGNFVYVLQAPFPKLPISLSNVAAILQETYQKSKASSSTGVPSSSESGAPQVDKGLSLKRLSKAVDKIYPPSKRGTSVASGVLKRPESGDLVAVGGKRTMGEWFKSGFGRVVGTKEEKGGQYKNEEELADLVTPFSLDGR